MKKQFRLIALAVAALLIFGAVFAGCAKQTPLASAQKDPTQFLLQAFAKTDSAVKVQLPDKLDKLAQSAEKSGTVALTTEIEEFGTLEAKISYDVSAGQFAGTVSVGAEGQALTFELYSNGKEICLKAPEILGEEVYGLRVDNLKEDLKNASLWANLGVDYAQIQEEVEQYLDQIEKMMGSMDTSDDSDSIVLRAQKLAEDIKAITDGCKPQAAESTIGTGENAPASVLITYVLTQKQFEQITDLYVSYLDEITQELLKGMEDIGQTDISLDELKQGLKELAGEYTVSFNVGNDTGMVSEIRVSLDTLSEGSPIQLSAVIDLGADPASSKEWNIGVTLREGSEEPEEKLHAVISINDTDTLFDRSVTIRAEGVDSDIVIRVAVGDGKFDLSASAEGETAKLTGTYELSDTRLSVTLDKLTAEGKTMDLHTTVTVDGNATVPSMPAYKDLLNLSQDDFIALMQSIQPLIPQVPDEPVTGVMKTVYVQIIADQYDPMADVVQTDCVSALDFALSQFSYDYYGNLTGVMGFSPDYDWMVDIYVNDALMEFEDIALHEKDTVTFRLYPFTGE